MLFNRPFLSFLTQPKPQSFQNISSKFGNLTRNSFYNMAKLWKPIPLQSKRPSYCHSQGLKLSDGKHLDYKPFFFLQIPSDVCFSFDWVPRLIQKSFQSREHKLVQRCEIRVGVDACKASEIYLSLVCRFSSCFLMFLIYSNLHSIFFFLFYCHEHFIQNSCAQTFCMSNQTSKTQVYNS